jgi:hypothetical protein
VTAAKVEQIFIENDPMGTTNLAAVLMHATDSYFQRKAAKQTKPNGETILVVTDGAPDDLRAVMEVIIQASRRMEQDHELAISFIQIGDDKMASNFIKALDEQLQGAGAKFDLCDAIAQDEMADMSLAEVLMNAIND